MVAVERGNHRAVVSEERAAIARPIPLARARYNDDLPGTCDFDSSNGHGGNLANMSDPFRGEIRPFGLGFWPLGRRRPGRHARP